ncbi:hypothetical protein NZD89_14100 [Alicyclobacillus fastidiosus]|uniref:Uncharacterized protein n=1 Tax=Alicyclobacillus fastidiosus TaxID=392011 RepID=A0ABY6ZR28_9BACL|nr:hypothetical protein [Alicyclobacillus fastidiosus]WAH44420.1 hypothetical protein NZD89_14100 [Alicyclobacillus fastidiosus]GMA60760.1 hypothetical protein GCM10025859_12000 [Alicyclobacillus fastidiosus]
MEIYRDSYTVLTTGEDEIGLPTLFIEYRGSEGSLSFTEIEVVRGKSDAGFVSLNEIQPITTVIIDALSQPEAFVFEVPADGDGQKLFNVIDSLRVI